MALRSFRILSKFIRRTRDKVGIAKAVLGFAEFCAKMTKSKKDDKFVTDLKKMVSKFEGNLSKAEAVKAKAEEVAKVVKNKKK